MKQVRLVGCSSSQDKINIPWLKKSNAPPKVSVLLIHVLPNTQLGLNPPNEFEYATRYQNVFNLKIALATSAIPSASSYWSALKHFVINFRTIVQFISG